VARAELAHVQLATAGIELHSRQGSILPSSKKMFAPKLHVASIYFKCFRGMLQVFYINVTKVDLEVARVAMVFSSICRKCFICFRRMLQVFYLDVAKVDLDVAYTCMLQAYVSSISAVSYVCRKCFILMLHMFCNGYKRVLLVFQTYIVSV
jgi:hypothetical protein